MQGKKEFTPKIMYQIHLDDLVPQDNFYRKVSEAVDFRFLYESTEKYYGTEGQESVDPVVFFKICLVGYLNNINSDRKLIEYCSNCLDVRLFLKYDIDEPLPWHSTISRTRQLYGEEIFLNLFKKVLSLCIEKGMVRGKRQAIDSALIKANASMDSLLEKPVVSESEAAILQDAVLYADELYASAKFSTSENSDPACPSGRHKINPQNITPEDKSSRTVSAQKQKDVEQHHQWKKEAYKDMPSHGKADRVDENGNLIRPKFLSNHTHYSPTDPDARIAVKPGKARQMNYYAQLAVDESNHVITAAGADYADKRDSECLQHIVNQTIGNLQANHITLEQITADTGYSSGETLKFCKEKNIDAYIPNFGQYKPGREGFVYNKAKDRYECQRGHRAIILFKKVATDSKGYTKRVYRSDNSKCKDCPLRTECIGKSDFKKIEDSIHKPLYDVMHEKLKSAYAKRIMRKRSSTVEPVLGTLINFLNMKRINTRGIKQANKHILMAALVYNLKKYLKYMNRQRISACMQLKKQAILTAEKAFSTFLMLCAIMKHHTATKKFQLL